MYCFVAGVDPAEGNVDERMAAFLEEVGNYEGFIQVGLNEAKPWLCMLCFKDKESATEAQWMMEIGGSVPQKGGAGREEGAEYPGNYHGQQEDRTGD